MCIVPGFEMDWIINLGWTELVINLFLDVVYWPANYYSQSLLQGCLFGLNWLLLINGLQYNIGKYYIKIWLKRLSLSNVFLIHCITFDIIFGDSGILVDYKFFTGIQF